MFLAQNGKQIILNRNIHAISTVMKLVSSLAAEAKFAALFLNDQQARIIRLFLREMGHPQPPMYTNTHRQQHMCWNCE